MHIFRCHFTGMNKKYIEGNSSIIWVRTPTDLLAPPDSKDFIHLCTVARKNSDKIISPIESSKDSVALKNAVQRTYAARFVALEYENRYEV